MTGVIDPIRVEYQTRLTLECQNLNNTDLVSILRWLLGEELEKWEKLDSQQLKIARQGLDYRVHILKERYLGKSPQRAYQNLMERLGSFISIRGRISTGVSISRDRTRSVVGVIAEVIQEMLHRDRYLQQQILWIAQCTRKSQLRTALLLTTIEEYCLRNISNRPLFAHRCLNYLDRDGKGGVTNISPNNHVKLLSNGTGIDDDSDLSLFDLEAQAKYEQQQNQVETQSLRDNIYAKFKGYLVAQVGTEAGIWLDLYLQGKTPPEIANVLQMEIAQIYRLRETIAYQAIKVFAIKSEAELVSQWLNISLQEHNLGLTYRQWQEFWQRLNPQQRDIVTSLKAGNSVTAIADKLNLKTNQVEGEWRKAYLIAQAIRRVAS